MVYDGGRKAPIAVRQWKVLVVWGVGDGGRKESDYLNFKQTFKR